MNPPLSSKVFRHERRAKTFKKLLLALGAVSLSLLSVGLLWIGAIILFSF